MQFKQKSLKTYSGVTSTLLQRQYKHNLKRKQQIIYVDYTQVTQCLFLMQLKVFILTTKIEFSFHEVQIQLKSMGIYVIILRRIWSLAHVGITHLLIKNNYMYMYYHTYWGKHIVNSPVEQRTNTWWVIQLQIHKMRQNIGVN